MSCFCRMGLERMHLKSKQAQPQLLSSLEHCKPAQFGSSKQRIREAEHMETDSDDADHDEPDVRSMSSMSDPGSDGELHSRSHCTNQSHAMMCDNATSSVLGLESSLLEQFSRVDVGNAEASVNTGAAPRQLRTGVHSSDSSTQGASRHSTRPDTFSFGRRGRGGRMQFVRGKGR